MHGWCIRLPPVRRELGEPCKCRLFLQQTMPAHRQACVISLTNGTASWVRVRRENASRFSIPRLPESSRLSEETNTAMDATRFRSTKHFPRDERVFPGSDEGSIADVMMHG